MAYQREWRGNKIVALNILVHPDELDTPNRQLGSLMLSPDPPPKRNARPESYTIDEESYMITEGGQALLTSPDIPAGFQQSGFQSQSHGGFQTGSSDGSLSIIDAPITPEPGP